jgi:membrane associated rhomboid family serine protease
VIFPILFKSLEVFISPLRVPLTYLFLALNVLVFLVTLPSFERVDNELDLLVDDRTFMEVQGVAFSVMIEREPLRFSKFLSTLAKRALAGESDSRRILGSLAIRNFEFMNRAESYSFEGDELALKKWRGRFLELKALETEHPSYLWGLSRSKGGLIQYISYQFAHSGVVHLFWNMIFLLIFGAFIELNLGASFVVLAYVGSGVAGAVVFSKLSGISSAPLVGASAAVSGLMALVGVVWLKKENLNFFFWLLPVNGYFGFVALPSWLILFVSLLPDISGFLGSSFEFGSVAYSAHIGGAVFGAMMGAALLMGLLQREIDPTGLPPSSPPSPPTPKSVA